jgi:hypothetical protein
MRVLVLVLAFLALPAVAAAQQALEAPAEAAAPKVELQQSAPTVSADGATAETVDVKPVTVEQTRSNPADAAAQAGDPTTTRWWWLVGAIVVGLVIAAALL